MPSHNVLEHGAANTSRVLPSGVRWVVLVLCLSAAALWAAYPPLATRFFRTECAKVAFDVNSIAELAREYRERELNFPASLGELEAWRNRSGHGRVRLRPDPWAREYVYSVVSGEASVLVTVGTLGKDGVHGGQGQDEDYFVEVR